MTEAIVDKMFRILFNNVSEDVIDNIPEHETAALISGMWNAFHPKGEHLFAHEALDRVNKVYEYRRELRKLRTQPYIAQRTEEWYALRKQRLTASDTAQALGKGKFGTRDQLIQKKVLDMRGESPPFRVMPAMKWGIMFEDMAMRCYQQANDNVRVHEFGMIPHETLSCFGASPDGITALGIMTEIKCPFKRKITGEVPDYYELQMQGQMAVCNLKECDYIECEMQVFDNYEDYELMVDGSLVNHGVICEFVKDGETYYEYSDALLTSKQANTWAREFSSREMRRDASIQLKKLHMWKLRQMFVKRVYFDEDRWNTIVPEIERFWNDVKEAHSTCNKTVSQCDEDNITTDKKKYGFISDSDDDDKTIKQ